MQPIAALEAGVVTGGDIRIHAIRKTVHGRRAVCGAGSGAVLGLVPGKFAEVAEGMCSDCLALALPGQPDQSSRDDSRSTASA